MKKIAYSISLALAIVAIGGCNALAQNEQHQAHHPDGWAKDATSTAASQGMPSTARPDMAQMDAQMKSMQDMHAKMMATKTPAERNALMAVHMKTMQDSMTMMNGMSAGGMGGMKGDMGARHQMMEKRMEMMHATMQMMMDRLPATPAK